MKKALQALLALTLLAAVAEGIILVQIRLDPWRLLALTESAALLIGLFAAFTQAGFIKQLREWAQQSAAAAAGMAALLLVPYLILGLGTRTFTFWGMVRLVAYIAVPTVLLWPDRLRHRPSLNWRDALAMAALAVPVSAGWLKGIWTWPQDLYIFRPIFCVILAGYTFMVLRNLDGVGFRLVWKKRDISSALLNLLAYSIIAIPLGLAMGFLHPHSMSTLSGAMQGNWPVLNFLLLFVGIYLTVALPEELLFRGTCKYPQSDHQRWPPGHLRAGDCLGRIWSRASAPSARPQLALCHHGDPGGTFLWQRLQYPATALRLRLDSRARRYHLAFLALSGLPHCNPSGSAPRIDFPF